MTSPSTARQLAPFRRPLIKNAWYCAAWSEEVGEALLARRILDEPVLLYRATSGEPVALLDVCPHKLAPMHLGKRIGDKVMCGYHGVEFDKDGRCVRNPQGNGFIPREAKLRAYAVVERYGVVWIWMGDPAKASADKIPDFSHLVAANRRTLRGGHRVACNYTIMIENLLDLGHGMFLHNQTAGVSEKPISENKLTEDGTRVMDFRLYRNVPSPSMFVKYLSGTNEPLERWNEIRWDAPASMRNHAGVAPIGHAQEDGFSIDVLGSHFLTPETQESMHYFYAHSRNYGQDDPAVDQIWRDWQKNALLGEDSMMAEAIQKSVSETERLGIDMVLLSTDASGVRANKILDRLAAAEA